MTLAVVREIREVAGYGRYFELTDAEAALLVLAHFAVAAAACAGSPRRIRRLLEPFEQVLDDGPLQGADIDGFVASVLSRSHDWRTTLAGLGDGHDAQRLRLLAVSLCTRPLMVSPAILVDSTAHRRMDAVLDLWDVESSCVEIQQMHFDTVQVLSGSSMLGDWLLATNGVQPYATMLARVEPSQRMTGQPTASEIARAVVACRFAFVGPEQLLQAQRLRAELGFELSSVASGGLTLLAEFDPSPAGLAANG